MNAVELSGVTKVDEGGAILDSVSLAIPAEAFWAVMGAGPCLSALLAVASGRVQPDLGTSLLFGQPAHKSRKAAALVQGDSFALEFADVRTNVEARALILGLPHPARAAAEALRAAGIDFQGMRAQNAARWSVGWLAWPSLLWAIHESSASTSRPIGSSRATWASSFRRLEG